MSKKPSRRAAIYIRVSSELQAEKISPQEQEADCLAHAKEMGYEIISIYRDLERYRVGSRLVEPSGTRRDRPGYKLMLRDAEAEKFDLVIAWREDRLYRSMRPMLDLLDLVKQGTLDVELVKETFDRKMAGIRASIAEMEIDAFRERTHMGVKGRLKQGKSWGGYRIYGYARDGDEVAIDSEETQWVRQIFDWYTSDVGVREISRRLIAEGVPPKRGRKQHIRWPMSTIYRILHNQTYHTGIHEVERDGQLFELPIPRIIDFEVFQATQEKLKSHHKDKARNVKHDYLLRGLVTSPCETSWHSYTHQYQASWRKKSTGKTLPYAAKRSYYRCSHTTSSVEDIHDADCPKSKGVVRLDKWVWLKVAQILREPQLLTEAARAKLENLKEKHDGASSKLKAIEDQLADIEAERKIFVQKYAKDRISGGPFTEADLDIALETLASEEISIKRDMADLSLVASTPFKDLEGIVEQHLSNILAGLEWLDREPDDVQEIHTQFEERRGIVAAIVDQVILRKSRDPEIVFTLDLSSIVQFHSIST